MAEKPTAAMVLSLIGGIFILLGGAFLAFAGSVISSLNLTGVGSTGSLVTALGVVGIILGLIIIVGGVMMYNNPQTHTMWGVVILVLSLVSWVTSIGGFVIGFLLALIGGILGIVFKPIMAPPAMSTMSMGAQPMGSSPTMSAAGMKCPACGAMTPAGSTKCPNCGAML